jgi:hypothetical protein
MNHCIEEEDFNTIHAAAAFRFLTYCGIFAA